MSIPTFPLTPEVLSYLAPEPALTPFKPPKDRALFADPNKESLLSLAKAVNDLTPHVGTELEGIQLSHLTNAQRDELALLVSERGVVFFRNQDLTLDQQYKLTDYWGIRDRDPQQVDPRHVTVLGRNDDVRASESYGGDYHADHSFELNPPSYTILRFVRHPPTGGDTLFTSQAKLFDALSPAFKKSLSGLTAIHSSEQAYALSIARGGKPLRAPIRTEHPLIRTHPVTRKQIINYNPQFVIHIPTLSALESKHVLEFLREHLHSSDDFTIRWKWKPNSIAIWDNRSIAHRAVPGGYNPREREATGLRSLEKCLSTKVFLCIERLGRRKRKAKTSLMVILEDTILERKESSLKVLPRLMNMPKLMCQLLSQIKGFWKAAAKVFQAALLSVE